MATKVFLERPKLVKYEDLEIGLREPNTKQMIEITKERGAYLKSIRADEDGEGDIEIFLNLQKRVSLLLACSLDDVTNPWFANDAEHKEELAKNGILKNTVDEVPHKLHAAIWAVLTGAKEGSAPLEASTTENQPDEITSDLTPSSSESPST